MNKYDIALLALVFFLLIQVFIGGMINSQKQQLNQFESCVEWQQDYVKRNYGSKSATIQEIKLDDRVERFCALSK